MKSTRIQTLSTPSHGIPHVPGTPILAVDSLSVRYGARSALAQVTFKLEVGERVAVVGPNGAGKSTLFKVIAGILAPSEGNIQIFGSNPGSHVCIAFVPQRNTVDWNFPATVADVVMMGRVSKLGLFHWPRKADWDFVQRALTEVRLEQLGGRQIGELSGGQQQRMFIARALAQEAEMILMDEPLSGLDLQSQEDIFVILDELRDRQVTVMVATHDLDQAAQRFDSVLLINQRLLGFGKPGEVFTTEKLLLAYGGHLRLVQVDSQVLALTDTCCDEGEEE